MCIRDRANSNALPVLAAAKRPRFNQRKKTIFLFCFAVLFLLLITIAGVALSGPAMVTDFSQKNLPPSLSHIFGTDVMGHEMLARTVKGLSTSILIGLLAATVSAIIAAILGTMAATDVYKRQSIAYSLLAFNRVLDFIS